MTAPDLWAQLAGDFPDHQVPFLPAGTMATPGATRRMAMVLAYRGTAYEGWQVQPSGRTLQGVLEDTLGRLCGHPVRIHGAGRTDAGVHALGQVAMWDTVSRLAPAELIRALGAMLPPDLLVRDLGQVPPDFHPRFSARGKTYRYFLWPSCPAGLFLGDFLWPLAGPLDRAALEAGLRQLLGTVDLAAFSTRGTEVKGGTLRRIDRAELLGEAGGCWRLEFSGSGFLRHAVRNMVGTLVQVGQGRLEPEAIGRMLAAGQRLYPGPKAPPGGLYLARVAFGGD